MTSPGPSGAALERLQRDYRPAFLRYLSRRDEQARHAGYVLGRGAVARGQSMLELVAAHHVVLLEVLPDARDPAEVLAMSTAASEFLTEVLASFALASSAFEGVRAELEEARRELTELRADRDAAAQPPADG